MGGCKEQQREGRRPYMKVKKSMVFAAALACGLLLAVPLGAAAASGYRMAENGPSAREESGRLNRTFLCLNI